MQLVISAQLCKYEDFSNRLAVGCDSWSYISSVKQTKVTQLAYVSGNCNKS